MLYSFIRISKSFTPELVCNFDFYYFPFDYQVCFIEMATYGTDGNFVRLKSNSLSFTGSENVNEYKIETPEFMKTGKNSIKIAIKFKRIAYNKILTTLMPTILINLVSISKFTFKV